jgi:hypothetical protein
MAERIRLRAAKTNLLAGYPNPRSPGLRWPTHPA